MARKKDTVRAAEMQALLTELDRSGLTVKAFCDERGIPKSRLWYWRKRFRDEANPEAPPKLLPVTIVSEEQSATELVIEVRGRRIHVSPNFDVEVLRRLVLTLEAC